MGLSGLLRLSSFACLSISPSVCLSFCLSRCSFCWLCTCILYLTFAFFKQRIHPTPSASGCHSFAHSLIHSPTHSLTHSFIVIRSVCIYSCICLPSDACFRKIMCKQTWIKTKKKKRNKSKIKIQNIKRKTKKQKCQISAKSNKSDREGDNGNRESGRQRERNRKRSNEITCKSNLIAWPTTKGNSHCLLFALLLSMLILLTENKFINKYAYNFFFYFSCCCFVAVSVSVYLLDPLDVEQSALGRQKAGWQAGKLSSSLPLTKTKVN